jgi:hypothetical protein
MIKRTLNIPASAGALIRARNVAESSNTNVVVTIPGVSGFQNYIHHIQWSYDGTPIGGMITIQDGVGGTILWQQAITASGPGGQDPDELGTAGVDTVVTLAAGGSGVTGRLASVRAVRRLTTGSNPAIV